MNLSRSCKIQYCLKKNMYSFLIICFLASLSIVTANPERKYNNQSEVMDDMLDNIFICMQELEVNIDICSELLMKDKDHSDKKYNGCKCFGPCVAKKMGTMNVDSGKWNWTRFKELSILFDNEMLKKETKIMEMACLDEVNTHCEAGYAMMKCVLENSPMAKDMAKNYLAARESLNNGDSITEEDN
ncbi:uncharacterized protein LOC112693423 [Sipha flava]|uniref:Uncharacterized protein LOC112693423 n=1 Tax=Sipha flava TaxID=143950 RepID=A0A2S2R781_9HEMI|nr:uncharacterized protein LOC112693423 [Sipha flava]